MHLITTDGDRSTSSTSRGFTIAELMVVIGVLSVLVTITVLAFGNWHQQIAQKKIFNDLGHAQTAMENVRNFSTGFPMYLPTTFEASANVTITVVASTTTTYCLEGRSSELTNKVYKVTESTRTPTEASC